ncbi:hypothetical protein ACVW17_004783 [Bradyrhizobium sp. USDA 4473]
MQNPGSLSLHKTCGWNMPQKGYHLETIGGFTFRKIGSSAAPSLAMSAGVARSPSAMP